MQDLANARLAQGEEFVQASKGSAGVSVLEGGVVQLRIVWGETTLCVAEIDRSAYWIGESSQEREPEFVVSGEQLGVMQLPLVTYDSAGCYVNLLAHARGRVRFSKTEVRTLEEVIPSLPASPELRGGTRLSLTLGMEVQVQVGELRFELNCTDREKRPARAFAGEGARTALPYFATSLLSVGSLIGAMAFFVPPMGLTDGEGVDTEQLILMQAFLNASAEREREKQPAEAPAKDAEPAGGKPGAAAQGEEGAMGKPDAPAANARAARKGPAENTNPQPSPIEVAKDFGMVGLLAGGVFDPDSPSAAWADPSSLGADALSAQGNMWGDVIGEAGGSNGLGLFSLGDGGGGTRQGIGLGEVGTWGTLGNCQGPDCRGIGPGMPGGIGRPGLAEHKTKGPGLRAAVANVSGRLPKEVIQRIVRQNHGRFRLCYEQGLSSNPNLTGRVAVRFLIGSDGSVASAASGGSNLPNSEVTSCVVRAFYGLSFPKPEAGTVSVTYPITFSPE